MLPQVDTCIGYCAIFISNQRYVLDVMDAVVASMGVLKLVADSQWFGKRSRFWSLYMYIQQGGWLYFYFCLTLDISVPGTIEERVNTMDKQT